ncbi:MAG: hypothetical protein SXQ77_12955, partial [Halobacteria archaeon]|nr:hypothetical protein [Halobacteria archaeon]
LGAAFDFGTITDVAFDGSYFVGWLISVVVLFIGGIIVGVLGIIPIIGFIIGIFINFYFLVAAYNVIGRAFAKAQSA